MTEDEQEAARVFPAQEPDYEPPRVEDLDSADGPSVAAAGVSPVG